MKVIIIALTALIAGISAGVPNYAAPQIESRIVTDAIASAIEDFANDIRERGLDPLRIEAAEADYALPVPSLLTAEGKATNVASDGLSNIVIERLNYSVLWFRLDFTVSMPLITASVGDASAHVSTFGYDLNGQASGDIAIKDIRVAGEVRINLGIISGISISSLDINFTLGSIDSNLSLDLLGNDLSDHANNFLSNIIPDSIAAYRADINELIEIIAMDIINSLL